MSQLRFLTLFVSVILVVSCYNEKFETSGSATVSVSADTILFDTVFTSIGTVTKRFTIRNKNENSLKISAIDLAGGTNSPYRINVDGFEGHHFTDIVVRGNDSLYVFVEATIDPLGANLPMVVSDSILLQTNGNNTTVKLLAFGQDVNLLNRKILKTQTWTNTKPYLIYNNAALDTGEVLTITEGTQIYMHANSSLLIYGTLKVEGSSENPVVFTGDRFDRGYSVSAGQWGTIYFDEDSKENTINHAVIKNAVAGMQIGFPGDRKRKTDITISNCIIQNASFAGIYAFYADLTAYNTIITDCGSTAIFLRQGGRYNFYHCTVSNINSYYNYLNKEIDYRGKHALPSVIASNFFYYYALDRHFNIVDSIFYNDLEECNFVNSIITGKKDEEIALVDTNTRAFNYLFKNCIVEYTESDKEDSIDISDPVYFKNVFLNRDTLFVNANRSEGEYNFTPDSLSVARNNGNIEIVNQYHFLLTDFEGKSRTADGLPDIGAIERYGN